MRKTFKNTTEQQNCEKYLNKEYLFSTARFCLNQRVFGPKPFFPKLWILEQLAVYFLYSCIFVYAILYNNWYLNKFTSQNKKNSNKPTSLSNFKFHVSCDLRIQILSAACIFNSLNGKQKRKKNRKKGRNAYILCKTSYADLKITISLRKP